MSYTIIDHTHNFAVWTSAISVVRNFTKTPHIKSAIEHAELKKLLIDTSGIHSAEDFDNFHKEKAKLIMDNLMENKNVDRSKISYGRAAKIIAIYIKTAIIIPNNGDCELSKFAHPPIDRILLSNLSKQYPDETTFNTSWTKLNDRNYFEIIGKLRNIEPNQLWRLEKHWIL